MKILSFEDLFTTGVAFDLLGGYLLARGLLTDPRDMAHRASTLLGYNSAIVDREVRARIDGLAGLTVLALGFLFQFGGYVAVIGGAKLTTTGGSEAAVAVAVAVAMVLIVSALLQPIRTTLEGRLRPVVMTTLHEMGADE